MKKTILHITRFHETDKQSVGVMNVYRDGDRVFTCKTIELPWKDNERSVSCIPAGSYNIKQRRSEKFGLHYHLLDVPGRSFILIHQGNFYTQIEGCILVGRAHKDINSDGQTDVVNSLATMRDLLKIVGKEAILHITDLNRVDL